MNAISTGVDLIEIDRLRTLNPKIKDRFFQRVFTPAELEETPHALEHLAGKFAAKEAASKALGCGIGEVAWHDLEILDEANGRPLLTLHSNASLAAQKVGWLTWSVSISHTRTHALAVVTALIETSQA